jgi:GntR family transcriptional regulator, transcriptional repressor for pyruvate dehydrogenase complex
MVTKYISSMAKSTASKAPRASEETLAALFIAIFDGSYAPDDTLPPERVLAERYGVSRIVVRQAIHRLHDAGLVKASQGGATRVLDPDRADARALELVFRFGHRLGAARQLRRDLVEYQELYGLALVEGAFRRGTAAEYKALLARIEDTDKTPTTTAARALARAVWRALTAMCRNPIFKMEMALFEQWIRDDEPLSAPPAELRDFYHGLASHLANGQDPIPFFLAHTRGDRPG